MRSGLPIGKATFAAGVCASAFLAARRRRSRTQPDLPEGTGQQPRIVIAGAGFAGISLLEELRTHLTPGEAEVVLIDRHNYHLFTPLLYQVATGSVDSANIAYALRPFCHQHGVQLLCAEIRNVNLIDNVVETDKGTISYDYLVLGLGSRTNFFGMQDVERRSQGLKTLAGAGTIRRTILDSIERAAQTSDPAERRRLLTFVVVGAGATGVELVGSIHDLLHKNLLPYYADLDPSEARIILVEATDTILPGVTQRIRDISLMRFESLGIDVKLNTAVAGIKDGNVVTRDGSEIAGDTVIWTAGIRPNPVTAGLAVEKGRDGRLVVDEYLRLPRHPEVFALGDNALIQDIANGKALPPNAAVAVQQGNVTAHNLVRALRGEPLQPFRYHPIGELIALGRLRAAAQLGPFVFGGLPAWLVWRVVYLTKIMGMKNRTGVLMDWVSSLLSRRYIVSTES